MFANKVYKYRATNAHQVVVGFAKGSGVKTFRGAFKCSRFGGNLFVCDREEEKN